MATPALSDTIPPASASPTSSCADPHAPFEVLIDSSPASAGHPLKYRPLQPELFAGVFKDEWLAAPFAAALERGTEASLRALLHEEVGGRVYSFEMLRPDFCAKLIAETEHYEASKLPVERPNTMNNYGVILNRIGMKPLLDQLQRRAVQPLAALLFPTEGSELTSHHTFMVQYKKGEDLGLDMHHDDSDVTLNVCLGKEFTGATLSFCGGFGTEAHRKHVHTYTHRVGRAVVHLGSHRHGADDITSGERYSLIMWSTGAFRLTEAYKAVHSRNLHGADGGQPDPICLSYTHDPDYGEYLPYPPGKAVKPQSRELHLARFTDEQAALKAEDLKVRGTADFKEGAWRAAACKYACGVDYARKAGRGAKELLVPLLLNGAQCHLKLGEAAVAAKLCSEALEREPENVKALYRRAVARMQTSENSEARQDLLAAAKLDPSNKEVRARLSECRAAAEAEKIKERALFAAMLQASSAKGTASSVLAVPSNSISNGELEEQAQAAASSK
ncbi:hypothetical protein AB1Y20_009299 [Prymnesium parvum]|uniref:Fe2OG dioxygenase domain-containing protein n=1 Tax=Prymnesium parvum TaxID=97485 RepID=A0AB34K4P1_PRYPA